MNFFFFCLFPLLSWISCSSEMKYLAGTEIVSTMWGCITFTEFALMLCMLAFERQNSIVWSSITPLLCIKVVYYEQRRETFNHTLEAQKCMLHYEVTQWRKVDTLPTK